MKVFTLRMLRNTNFFDLYAKLLMGFSLKIQEREALLQIAIILINTGDDNNQELGYRIIVVYCNLFDDYIPLYDVALNKGFIPVLKMIETIPNLNPAFSYRFFNMYTSSSAEVYRENDIYLTYQQLDLKHFFSEKKTQTVAVIAPTSYGKSELIIKFCKENHESNICIIVPTKALLAQTKRRLLKGLYQYRHKKKKLITHPEMYNPGDNKFIAILTQERLLRLIRKDPTLSFSTVFIDEAHNVLDGDQRNLLLTKTIALLEHRNSKTAFKFLTPFLVDSKNLKTRYTNYNIKEYKIDENIKTERFFTINFLTDHKLKAYDQFVNRFFIISETFKNDIDLINRKSARKNIIYLNSPPKIERFAKRLILDREELVDEDLNHACKDLSKFLHSEYALIDCIKRGFAYHHGSVPDVVKLYVEYLFSKNTNLSTIITSSTLLEGVNVPAEKLFLLEYTKGPRRLSPSQFKNLSGRVCRFSEIFNTETGSLSLLEPEIYVIASSYVRQDANIEKFLIDSVKKDKAIKDDLQNILLAETELNETNIDDKRKADEILENIEPGITGEKSDYAKTDVGKLCFENNISEIPIIENEQKISQVLEDIGKHELKTPEELLKVIAKAFVLFINDKHIDYQRLIRLKQESAQKFYCMFIKWRMRSASYSEMIKSFLTYWEKDDIDKEVYVGKWGDIVKEGHKKLWVNISEKSYKERVNLSIVRIKEEQDFLDNIILKFIEVLFDLELVNEKLYLKIKYGTEDARKITMIKCGISSTLATLLLRKYINYVSVDIKENIVEIDPDIVDEMVKNHENRVLIFEIGFNIS